MITYSFLLSFILLFNLSLYASRLICCNFKMKLFNKNFSCWNCRQVYFAHIIVLLEQRLVLSCLWLFWKISSLILNLVFCWQTLFRIFASTYSCHFSVKFSSCRYCCCWFNNNFIVKIPLFVLHTVIM